MKRGEENERLYRGKDIRLNKNATPLLEKLRTVPHLLLFEEKPPLFWENKTVLTLAD
jgi:hypothetical protein